jgi:hypothetical protein
LQLDVQPDGPTVTDVVFELIVVMPLAETLAVLVIIPPASPPGATVTRNPTVAEPPGLIVPTLKVSVPLL